MNKEPLRLLLVEDDPEDAELVRLELERGGFDLVWERVDTEVRLRQMLREREWDLIVSDFAMPTFNGLRAFEVFREMKLDTPFIFVSGALGEERAVAAMRAGARDYFLKDKLARLTAAVRRELSEARSRRERRQAEAMAARERRRLSIALDASGAGVFEHRWPPDAETYHSESWAKILGRSLEGLPAPERRWEWFLEAVHPDDVQVLVDAYEAMISGKSERCAVEVRVQHEQDHWVDAAIYAKAVQRERHGRATQVVGVMLDLTERRQLEAQLRQAQKMEAVGRLAGGVAHDFNNLLTAIFSFGRFVLDELEPEQPAYADMQQVLKAAEKAESLTAQLLAFSRRKPVSPKTININSLVADIDRILTRVVGEDVEIWTMRASDLWNVRIDPGSLEQVIVNLAVNARDAMPNGGRLTIETANEEVDDEYGPAHGATVPPGEYVIVSVSDDGTGMDEATKNRIFEPFFSTKEPGKGTGLGLSTCYGIVKQAGGFIWVYSELGQGTTFKLCFPRVVEEAEQVVERSEPVSLRGGETILVAEDDDQVRELAVRALSRLGYRVLASSRPDEAIERSRTLEHGIDLLLTDVVMPGMSGRDLAGELTRLRPDMKVIYMSGYTENAIAHRGVLESGTHFVHKPFTPNALARMVRRVLDD